MAQSIQSRDEMLFQDTAIHLEIDAPSYVRDPHWSEWPRPQCNQPHANYMTKNEKLVTCGKCRRWMR